MLYKCVPKQWIVNTQEFWAKRLHTLAITGNGAAVVLLGSLIENSKDITAIQSIKEDVWFFIPFIFGIISCAFAAINGALETENIAKCNENSTKLQKRIKMDMSQWSDAIIKANIISMVQMEIKDEEFTDQKKDLRKKYVVNLFFAAFFFIVGLLNIGGFINLDDFISFLTDIEFTLQTYSHGQSFNLQCN